MIQLRPPYPLALDTVRACPYCSYREQCTGIDFMIHVSNHTNNEKRYLQSGDITRIISILEAELLQIEKRSKNCCGYDDCLHNYSGGMDVRLKTIIEKLYNYINEGDVRVITALPVNVQKNDVEKKC